MGLYVHIMAFQVQLAARLNYEPLINVLASASTRSVVDKSRATAYDCCDCCELKGTISCSFVEHLQRA